jgi:hypothetical protein
VIRSARGRGPCPARSTGACGMRGVMTSHGAGARTSTASADRHRGPKGDHDHHQGRDAAKRRLMVKNKKADDDSVDEEAMLVPDEP